MSDSSCLMHYFSVFGYQMKHSFSCLIVWYVTAQCLDIRWNTPSRVWDILLLLFDTLLLVVWISDETLLHLFNILRLGVWISDETFLLVFDVLLLGVCYQMKHPCRLWYIASILLKNNRTFRKQTGQFIVVERIFRVYSQSIHICLMFSFFFFFLVPAQSSSAEVQLPVPIHVEVSCRLLDDCHAERT